jgi:hypothetical protein
MLRTIAAGLIVTALIAAPAAAQPSGGTNATPATTTKHPGFQSNTKSTSRLKQTNTTEAEKVVKHNVDPRPRRHVVHHHISGHQRLAGRHHTLSPRRHPAAAMTDQHTQSNGYQKASRIEITTNTQK